MIQPKSRQNPKENPKTRRKFQMKNSTKSVSKQDVTSLKEIPVGYLDQDCNKYIRVTVDDVSTFAKVTSLLQASGEFFARLEAHGIILATSGKQNQIKRDAEEIRNWSKQLYVARSTGWHKGCYIAPDQHIYGKPGVEAFHLEMPRKAVPLGKSGTYRNWKKAILKYVKDQHVLTTIACSAYVGPILDLLGEDNFILDVTGPSSIGKSSALDVHASIWGAPRGLSGSMVNSLRTTDNGLEQAMLEFRDSSLLLDESNLLGVTEKAQAEALMSLAFLLGEGVEKTRFNQGRAERVKLISLITSNASLVTLLERFNKQNAQAATARLIPLHGDAGHDFGVFSTLPADFETSSHAIQGLRQELKTNHGHSMSIFLQRLVEECDKNRDGVVAGLRASCRKFHSKYGVDQKTGLELRQAQAFALIYAAATLAHEYGAWPIAAVGKSIMACCRQSLKPICQKSPIERLAQFHGVQKERLTDLNAQDFAPIADDELNSRPGFTIYRRRRKLLLLRRQGLEALFGDEIRSTLIILKKEKILVCNDGFQLQLKVRSNRAKDRMYAVDIAKLYRPSIL